MVGFALSSGITIGMISPFMKVLFTPRPAASGQGPAAAVIPGGGALELALGSTPRSSGNASGTYVPGSGLAGRVNAWKQDLRTWFEHFFLTGNPLRSLTRICLALLVVFMLKNMFDYLQNVLTVWVEQAVVRDLRSDLYAHLHDLSLSFFHTRRTGALLSRLTNDISLVRGSLAAGFSNTSKQYFNAIYSQTKKEHREHVRQVVARLRDAGLQIDINKCEFETTRTKYLGLIITLEGIEMDSDKVTAISSWLPPSSVRDLQKFLGFANFYRRFIRNFSQLCRPLNDLLKKGTPWQWERAHQQAFESLKVAFSTAPTLAFFDYNRKTILETDASDWASGGVLSQIDDEGRLRPVAYFSSKHSTSECNYEIYDKELLAIIKSLEEWRPELQGTQEPFEIITDHKNLEYFTTTKALNQRQVRWSEFLSGFNFRIVYRPGNKAARPDALSRKQEHRPSKADPSDERLKNRERVLLPANRFESAALENLLAEANSDPNIDMTAAPIDMVIPATDKPIDDLITAVYVSSDMINTMLASLRDPECRKWPKALRKELRIAMTDCKIVENKIYYKDKLFLPPDDELRTQVIYRTHSTGPAGHPGRTKTLDLLSRTYWWPRMSRDVEEYVRACELCVRTKSPRSLPQGFLQPLPVPFRAWSDISVDYITPLPTCERHGTKYKHILVVVCRLTKMRHFIAVTGLSADELATAFIGRVYSLHGCPDNIVSDRGTQFVSEF